MPTRIAGEAQDSPATGDQPLLGTGRTVGVFDAGIGGLPIAKRVRDAAPGASILYLGDTARRPYGPQPREAITGYVSEVERFMSSAGVDVWIIACNTASVVAQEALFGLLPVVDMVAAATSCVSSETLGPIGVLGTEGTIASGAYTRALPEFEVLGVAAEELLRLAELGGGDDPKLLEQLARASAAPLLESQVTTAILACTDFTCILPTMERAFGAGITLIDPADRAVELACDVLRKLPDAAGSRPAMPRDRLCFTAPAPVDARAFAREQCGLEMPDPEYVTLT